MIRGSRWLSINGPDAAGRSIPSAGMSLQLDSTAWFLQSR
ncbi:hypothetical protein BN134_3134 [Cronobacter dublinensis 1210]|uniref:Uncharacterized protein n=1 Tax=Cronobacter dublinensis 1210 TaxID=1208656 RepID=A0ABP1WD75_9ENTR|nr:hypothetical protein BN134_3134 [Cronobacter dublinensis 1210]